MLKYGTLLVLALGLSINATGCDQSEGDSMDESFRSGTLGTGATLTLNTNKWVSSAARDVYEFSLEPGWHLNSFGYEVRLASLTVVETPYGNVTSAPGEPLPGQPHAKVITGQDDFTVEVSSPNPANPKFNLTGADLLGMRLLFDVRSEGEEPHPVIVQVVSHDQDDGGHVFEFKKVDPVTGQFLAPLCEEDMDGQRVARIYEGFSVDGNTGAMGPVENDIHHIACTSSAPGKALQFGYSPTFQTIQTFKLANRVIRADYCGDGHPYTYPGNLVAIEDNVSYGQEGKTLADVYASLPPDEVLEAVWNPDGVMCMDTPRAGNLERNDIVCPTKHFADGSVKYNWRPPNCSEFNDNPPPGALRFYSRSAL